jgi:hypothetical protein
MALFLLQLPLLNTSTHNHVFSLSSFLPFLVFLPHRSRLCIIVYTLYVLTWIHYVHTQSKGTESEREWKGDHIISQTSIQFPFTATFFSSRLQIVTNIDRIIIMYFLLCLFPLVLSLSFTHSMDADENSNSSLATKLYRYAYEFYILYTLCRINVTRGSGGKGKKKLSEQ